MVHFFMLVRPRLALRFLWPADMEWKHDEQWNYAHAQAIAQGQEPWPSVGQQTSAVLNNFPLGLWLLAAFSLVSHSPIGLMLLGPHSQHARFIGFPAMGPAGGALPATTRNLAMGLDVGRGLASSDIIFPKDLDPGHPAPLHLSHFYRA